MKLRSHILNVRHAATRTALSLGAWFLLLAADAAPAAAPAPVLRAESFRHYVDEFNAQDDELYRQLIPNAEAWKFLAPNIPLFECPDREIELTYYFRWWTFRKHLKETPDGVVITEFLPPVPWAAKYNTIDCAAGHHLYEGRWLHDPRFLDDYSRFWFRGGGDPRRYSFWAADAIWARYLVTTNRAFTTDLLPDLVANFDGWVKTRFDPAAGLFWQNDGEDGMEVSIGGSGYRATINSYLFGEAVAITRIAELAGNAEVAARFRAEAARIKAVVEGKLWDEPAEFFKVLPRTPNAHLADVRELHGYTPWYFHLPEPRFAEAWKQLVDPEGFRAPFGPTTAEQRHPKFAVAYSGHECQWNGPSWPYATAVTLTALANVLNDLAKPPLTRQDYFDALRTYALSHRLKRADGRVVPWIDENLNPTNGDWIARTLLRQRSAQPVERGKDYNHSTFCDLVISGLVGLRPRADNVVEVNPLLPEGRWDWFCLDRVPYHSRQLTILWDKTGARYGKGTGLRVFADGMEIASTPKLGRVTGSLPAAARSASASVKSGDTAAGWTKSPANPVLGGALGTCFDVTLLKEADRYRMWFSWRPKKSVALVESADGIHWSEPQIVLGPNAATDWEADINRPVVVKNTAGYHLWYTGQAREHSWIGYATSPDGVTWNRQSAQPVLSPEAPWEKVAVMCPHVEWDAAARQFRMWYSGGEQYEPDAIGYATSPDGLHWTKDEANPIFRADPMRAWEQHKVTACQVLRHGDWFYMFYIGFRDKDHAQIGVARSRDGRTHWERHPANPIIQPTPGGWDHDACYKPFAIFDGHDWRLWYNGRRGGVEQIGLAFHPGEDLGFDPR